MSTPKEAIAEALQSLDQTNDALWTDDGAPLVAEIQRLTNDKTITRAQINEALPGFARKQKDSVTEDVQPDDEPDVIETAAQSEGQAPVDPEDFEDENDEDGRLRMIAHKRVLDAQKGIEDAKAAVSQAMKDVAAAEARHTRALQLFSAKYPPLTAAENIKQHLARQTEILRERVEGARFVPNVPQNPLDAKLQNRHRDNGRNKPVQTQKGFIPRSLAVGG
jgi:hypothetical protein